MTPRPTLALRMSRTLLGLACACAGQSAQAQTAPTWAWRLDAASERTTFADPARGAWQYHQLHAQLQPASRQWGLGLGVERTQRFGRRVDEWSVDGQVTLDPAWIVQGQLKRAPPATWRPRHSSSLDLLYAGLKDPGSAWLLGLGVRAERTPAGLATGLEVSAHWEQAQGWQARAASRSTRQPEGTQATALQLAVTAPLGTDWRLRWTASRGPEFDGTRWQPARSQSLALAWQAAPALSLRAWTIREHREGLGASRSQGLSLTTTF